VGGSVFFRGGKLFVGSSADSLQLFWRGFLLLSFGGLGFFFSEVQDASLKVSALEPSH